MKLPPDMSDEARQIVTDFLKDNEPLIDEIQALFTEYSHHSRAASEFLRGAAKIFRRGSGDPSKWDEFASIHRTAATEMHGLFTEKTQIFYQRLEATKTELAQMGYAIQDDLFPSDIEDWPEFISEAEN